MPNAVLSAAVSRIGRAVRDTDETTDGQLLTQFALTADEGAFGELVRRLGPMVLSVCQRVSGDAHLADDAFQAAFLVLARRASDVHPREAVRAWMYGVAVRTAREARSVSARRRSRELSVSVVPERTSECVEELDADVLRALDEEIAALPEHLRAAVVLCELDGVSRKDASAQLGILEGTVCSRLAKARKLLAAQLRKRGIAFSALAFTMLAKASATAVPPRLAASATGMATHSGSIPQSIELLSHGVFRTMFFQKLKLAAVPLLLVAALVVVASSLPGPAAEPPSTQRVVFIPRFGPNAPEEKKPAVEKPANPGKIIIAREGACWVVGPDGKKIAELSLPEKTYSVGQAWLSPDGTRAAFLVADQEGGPVPGNPEKPWPFKIVVRKIDKPDSEKVHDLPAHGLSIFWMPDGKRIVVVKQDGHHPDMKFENLLLDPETGKTEALKLPEGVRVLDCAKDGKTFVVETHDAKAKKRKLVLATTGEEKVRELCDLQNWPPASAMARLSPDGTKVLLIDSDPTRKHAHKWGCSHRVYLVGVKTGKREALPEFPENGRAFGVAWSPDGKRIAYAWQQLHDDILKKDNLSADDAAIETEAFLVIADTDGKNAKTIASDKGQFATNMVFGSIDWR
ncbi:MAG: sigma-70 family RNA polymerase sigma factor [Planctomycetia bacterium]|nr:sigma-70 family RNA polymerase sigma factor [Planctomycetia bacterium]